VASRALAEKELIHSLTLLGATPESSGKAAVASNSVWVSGNPERMGRMAANRNKETASRILASV